MKLEFTKEELLMLDHVLTSELIRVEKKTKEQDEKYWIVANALRKVEDASIEIKNK